jgi:hypothetical protein
MQVLVWVWLAILALLLLTMRSVTSVIAGAVVKAVAVRVVLGAMCGWVRVYTRLLDGYEREIRRADFRRDLL